GIIRSGPHIGFFKLRFTYSRDPVDYVIPLKSLYAANLPYDSISFKSDAPARLHISSPGP
ncbi:MAG: hypothetical protein LBE31_02300, partial [Deltaproteobacteria bacterium]|nr:hypothetical protein [Deltaproteobacteria bacterium]